MPWQPLIGQSYHEDWENGSMILTNNCTDGVQWIYNILSDCVWDEQGIASEVLGLASIVTWMIVSIPQMVKNFRHIEGIDGISLMLILMWTLGDTANLVGAILTKQLPLQVYLAIYFVFADLVLFAQFLYYNLWWKKKHKGYEPIQPHTHGVPQVVLCISGAMLLCINQSIKSLDISSSYNTIHYPAGRSLLSQEQQQHHNVFYHMHVFENLTDEVGYAIGIVSSIFYTFSRLGQMWKNYKRKSTEGLSLWMFILAVLGNLTYGLAILVRSLEPSYVIQHLPWLIGSLGVIFLDSSLLVQFRYYGEKDDFDQLLRDPMSNSSGADTEVKVEGYTSRRGTIN
ncbi:PQ loop repeat-containing protein 2 [Mactra antiquata]